MSVPDRFNDLIGNWSPIKLTAVTITSQYKEKTDATVWCMYLGGSSKS